MIRRMRQYINLTLALLKWPCAVFMLLCVPAVWRAFERYYAVRYQLHWQNLAYFGIGIAFFLFARLVFMSQRGCAETMEHEMTHTLFALATLHPVHRMTVNDGGGGSMIFSGGGNWLIALAPYFFPLAAFAMLVLCLFAKAIMGFMPEWAYIGLGCAVGYNLLSLVQQVHPGQTDFKVAGYLFTVCFLPGANMLSYGTLFSFAERGGRGVLFFYRLVFYYMEHDFFRLWSKAASLFS